MFIIVKVPSGSTQFCRLPCHTACVWNVARTHIQTQPWTRSKYIQSTLLFKHYLPSLSTSFYVQHNQRTLSHTVTQQHGAVVVSLLPLRCFSLDFSIVGTLLSTGFRIPIFTFISLLFLPLVFFYLCLFSIS